MPEIHGRDEAGVSAISSGQAPPATTMASPPPSSPRTRRAGAAQAQATASAGTTSSAAPILVENPSPTNTPASTIQRTRPPSSPRTTAHSAPTTHRTSSASGLLWRETATAIGVNASTAPPTNPPARPKRRATRSYTKATDATPINAWGTSMLQRTPPEHAHGQRLHHQRQRRLVHRHDARGVQRPVEERVPRGRHRANRARVVLVRPAVLRQRPQVQSAREHEQRRELGAGERDRAGSQRAEQRVGVPGSSQSWRQHRRGRSENPGPILRIGWER